MKKKSKTLKKSKTIKRQVYPKYTLPQLTSTFKKIIKYFEHQEERKLSIYEVTSMFLNRIVNGNTKALFNIRDIQELMHFIKIAEKESKRK